jgi:hypothetical protein
LYGAPKGSPRYFIGSTATLHPNMPANLSTSSTSLIGMVSDFDKLIFHPETTSKHKKKTFQATNMFTISLARD